MLITGILLSLGLPSFMHITDWICTYSGSGLIHIKIFNRDKLITMHSRLDLAVRGRHAVDAVYIDFARALDSIVHSELIFILSTFQISANL